MRLLLDESVPRPLRTSFPAAFEVRTVPEMGWAGSGNGTLLGLAADSGFDALLTVDRGFAHQRNQDDLPLPVVIMLAPSNHSATMALAPPGRIRETIVTTKWTNRTRQSPIAATS